MDLVVSEGVVGRARGLLLPLRRSSSQQDAEVATEAQYLANTVWALATAVWSEPRCWQHWQHPRQSSDWEWDIITLFLGASVFHAERGS